MAMFLTQRLGDHIRITEQGKAPITTDWDTLHSLIREVCNEDEWVVEVYPPEAHVVNEANIRHFWVIDEAHLNLCRLPER